MMEKRLIQIEEYAIAVKYDHKRKKAVIGGHQSTRGVLETIIVKCFGKAVPRLSWVQSNKIKYTFECKLERFDKAMRVLGEQGYAVSTVTNLKRIMR